MRIRKKKSDLPDTPPLVGGGDGGGGVSSRSIFPLLLLLLLPVLFVSFCIVFVLLLPSLRFNRDSNCCCCEPSPDADCRRTTILYECYVFKDYSYSCNE